MTSQGIYYLIRALVALVAIPFHEARPCTGRVAAGRRHRKAAGAALHEPLCPL